MPLGPCVLLPLLLPSTGREPTIWRIWMTHNQQPASKQVPNHCYKPQRSLPFLLPYSCHLPHLETLVLEIQHEILLIIYVYKRKDYFLLVVRCAANRTPSAGLLSIFPRRVSDGMVLTKLGIYTYPSQARYRTLSALDSNWAQWQPFSRCNERDPSQCVPGSLPS